MERLWSPWRSQYIGTFKDSEEKSGEECFFCDAIALNEVSLNTLITYIGSHSFVIMNKYPYNNGHLLISPIRHTGDITSLNSDELSEIMLLQVAAVKVLEEIFKPHGFNIGANLGRAAGAGVPGHLHYHVIPRWNGDTNFMPIIAETKILSQSLEDSFQLIADGFRKLIQ
jgi:ATP adenylyltransferase